MLVRKLRMLFSDHSDKSQEPGLKEGDIAQFVCEYELFT